MQTDNITSKVVADSVNYHGNRLTTMLCTYPRFVHAEHLRHRMFSFSVASSRAIPTKKFARLIRESPACSVWWGRNQGGMKARAELTGIQLHLAKGLWGLAKWEMLMLHTVFRWIGLHKQLANRLLEPWMPVTVLVTGTDWKNFFSLRSHADAQPEMCASSDSQLAAYCQSLPTRIHDEGWHLPFGDRMMEDGWTLEMRKMICVARAARTSYMNFDGVVNAQEDIALATGLAKVRHFSPFEHVARPAHGRGYHANFNGWIQYRNDFPGQAGEGDVNLHELLHLRRVAGSRHVGTSTHCCNRRH